jgi:3-methylfumaryl-CoA hydratase
LLLNFAAGIRGATPSSFSFRSLSTIFDGNPVRLHAKGDGDRLKL